MNKRSEPAIEEYLDRLCAQLGALPPELQSETREELRGHLQGLAAMQRDPQRIMESALRQFGDPSKIGRQLALEWEEGQWSLSGLTPLQRIDKIRDCMAIEVEAAKPGALLKALNWVQVAIIMLYFYSLSLQEGMAPGPPVSRSALDGARWGLLSLYFLSGMVACAGEWKEGVRRAARGVADGNRTWRNILSRASMAVLMPCLFLLPRQGLLISGAMIALCLFMAVWSRRQPSPRVRLATNASMVYGLLMGGVISVVNMWVFSWTGFGDWLWLLLLPLYYCIGLWFWKRPPLSRKARVLSVLVGLLILGSVATRAIERRNAKPPRTPQELVESWKDNGIYLAGDTDTAFMRAHLPEALVALRSGLRHRNSHVRMETANTIEGMGSLAKPLLPDIESRMNEEDDKSVRIYLAMTFGGIGDTSAKTIAFLRAVFNKEPDEEVKTYLAGSLARLTAPRFDPGAWVWLKDSLKPPSNAHAPSFGSFLGSDASWDRRWAAAYVLQEMGVKARPALPALESLRDDATTPARVKGKVEQAINAIK